MQSSNFSPRLIGLRKNETKICSDGSIFATAKLVGEDGKAIITFSEFRDCPPTNWETLYLQHRDGAIFLVSHLTCSQGAADFANSWQFYKKIAFVSERLSL